MASHDQIAGARRSFLRFAATAGLAGGASVAEAQLFQPNANFRDTAILQFTHALELVGADIAGQYGAAVTNNTEFRQALINVDPNLPQQVLDVARDEQSHADFLTAFLPSVGVAPINLDAFRTLPDYTGPFNAYANGSGTSTLAGAPATPVGHLVNLTNLTIDTSWYFKYRSLLNPDLGATFPQLIALTGQPTIPLTGNTGNGSITGPGAVAGGACPTGTSPTPGTGTGSPTQPTPSADLQGRAASALFHVALVEQTEMSVYAALGANITSSYVQGIVGSIGPIETAHYIAAHSAITKLAAFTTASGVAVPDIRCRLDASALFPAPTRVVSGLPFVAAVRPITIPLAGAVATANRLAATNLFQGQPPTFLQMMMQLAAAADATTRTCS